MNLEPPVRKKVSFAYDEAGQMMYIDEKEHHKLHEDVDEFLNAAYSRRSGRTMRPSRVMTAKGGTAT